MQVPAPTVSVPRHPVESARAATPARSETGHSQASESEPSPAPGPKAPELLTPEERRQLEKLKSRDREVRAHEAAHKAVAGQHARGGAQFEYERGPDGRAYAVGGEVHIDTSKVAGDPQATVEKAQRIRAAALAPAQPSAQDRAVASKAAAMAREARAELVQENTQAADPGAEPDRRLQAFREAAVPGRVLNVIA